MISQRRLRDAKKLYRQLQIYHNRFNNNYRLSLIPYLFAMAHVVVTFCLYTLILRYDSLEPFVLLGLLLVLLDCFLALLILKSMESIGSNCHCFADEMRAQTHRSRVNGNLSKSTRVTLKFVQSLLPLRIYGMNSYVQQGFFLQFIDANIQSILFFLLNW